MIDDNVNSYTVLLNIETVVTSAAARQVGHKERTPPPGQCTRLPTSRVPLLKKPRYLGGLCWETTRITSELLQRTLNKQDIAH